MILLPRLNISLSWLRLLPPPLQVFIINSEIHPYIRNNPDLLADQVDIPQADHSFLSHDSILNCIQAHQAFNISHLQQALLSDFSQM